MVILESLNPEVIIMKITDYSFGRITINGETYTSDVIIYPDRVDSSWWRKEGHLLQTADLKDIIKSNISTLIVGTGYSGIMRVPKETLDYLKSNHIEVYVEKSKEAVKLFNEISVKQPAIAALHLTC
jgi:hypothetical protein